MGYSCKFTSTDHLEISRKHNHVGVRSNTHKDPRIVCHLYKMNQYKITLDRLKELRDHIKAKTKNAFLEKFDVQVDGKGVLTYQDKRIIPKELIEDVIRNAIRELILASL